MGGGGTGRAKKKMGAIGDRAKREEEDRREGKTIFQIWMGERENTGRSRLRHRSQIALAYQLAL